MGKKIGGVEGIVDVGGDGGLGVDGVKVGGEGRRY